MTIDEVIKRYNDNAEYERTHGNLQGCLEFRQLAEWLRDYKRLKEQEPKTEKVIKMRDATPEERESIDKYIKSISKPTGIEFDIDIDKKVESYGKLLKHPVIKHVMDMDETPVTLSVSENPNKCDLISREAVEEIINDIRDCISVEGYWAILERLKKLPPVKPQESCDVPDTNDGKMSENPTDSKDVIWYSKRNYSEIVVEPQERSEE